MFGPRRIMFVLIEGQLSGDIPRQPLYIYIYVYEVSLTLRCGWGKFGSRLVF